MQEARTAIRGETKRIEEELIKLKKKYRDPEQQPPLLNTYYMLDLLKGEATLRYAVTAASRNKIHRHCDTPETQLEFILEGMGRVGEIPQLRLLQNYHEKLEEAHKAMALRHAFGPKDSGEKVTGVWSEAK